MGERGDSIYYHIIPSTHFPLSPSFISVSNKTLPFQITNIEELKKKVFSFIPLKPHSWLIDFVTRLTRRVKLEQELFTLSSSIYRFWLSLWYILVIVLSALPRFTDSDNLYALCYILVFILSALLRILIITPLVSSNTFYCYNNFSNAKPVLLGINLIKINFHTFSLFSIGVFARGSPMRNYKTPIENREQVN